MIKKYLFITLAFTSILFSCKKDKDEEKEDTTQQEEAFTYSKDDLAPGILTFGQLNAADVSSKISVSNSTRKSGTPPAPSTDFDAPTVYDYNSDNEVRVASGKSIILESSTSSDFAGYYIQVKGTNEYFDVPVSSNANLRKGFGKKDFVQSKLTRTAKLNIAADQGFEIQIPNTISTGQFCVIYCIYDSQNRVSNAVEKCINVQSFGGAGAESIVGTWNFEKAVYANFFSGNEKEATVKLNEPDIEEETTTSLCDDGTATTYNWEYTIHSFWLAMTSNGGMEYEIKSTDKSLDWNLSTCKNPVYETDADTEKETGAWAYDQASKTLTLLIEGYSYTDEFGTYYSDPDFIDFKVNTSNGKLILSYSEEDEGGDAYAVYYFNK